VAFCDARQGRRADTTTRRPGEGQTTQRARKAARLAPHRCAPHTSCSPNSWLLKVAILSTSAILSSAAWGREGPGSPPIGCDATLALASVQRGPRTVRRTVRSSSSKFTQYEATAVRPWTVVLLRRNHITRITDRSRHGSRAERRKKRAERRPSLAPCAQPRPG
jgi:hypothetical protein